MEIQRLLLIDTPHPAFGHLLPQGEKGQRRTRMGQSLSSLSND